MSGSFFGPLRFPETSAAMETAVFKDEMDKFR